MWLNSNQSNRRSNVMCCLTLVKYLSEFSMSGESKRTCCSSTPSHADTFACHDLGKDVLTFWQASRKNVIFCCKFCCHFNNCNVVVRKIRVKIWNKNSWWMLPNSFHASCGRCKLNLNQVPYAVWPDWVIYWTLGNFSKPLATINLPKSPTFLSNFL